MLAWPAGDIGASDLQRIEQALMSLPSSASAATLAMLKTLLDGPALPKAGLTDRIAIAYIWECLRQHAITGNHGYLADLQGTVADLSSRLGAFSAALLGEGLLAMQRDERATACARFREAANVEAFDAPLPQRLQGAYCIQDYQRLVEWGETAIPLAESEELLPQEIEWMEPPPTRSDRPCLLLAGDASSFLAHASKVLERLDRIAARCDVHFHVVNWTGECSKLQSALGAATNRRLGFSAESHRGGYIRRYAQVAAFLRAREIQAWLNAPLVIAEMTGSTEADPAALAANLGKNDIGSLEPGHGVRLPWRSQPIFPFVVANTKTARVFLRLLESYIRTFYGDEHLLTSSFIPVALGDVLHLMERGGSRTLPQRCNGGQSGICLRLTGFMEPQPWRSLPKNKNIERSSATRPVHWRPETLLRARPFIKSCARPTKRCWPIAPMPSLLKLRPPFAQRWRR